MMENENNFVSKLSLQDIALRRVIASIWTASYILDSIEERTVNVCAEKQYIPPKQDKRWLETCEKVAEKILNLETRALLNEQTHDLVINIGLEIREWKLCMEEYLSDSGKQLDARVLEQLSWSNVGAIDYKKTAERLVVLETLDVKKRFRLACLYCLEDGIPEIWKEIPDEGKRNLYDETCLIPNIDDAIVEKMVFYWVSVLKGEESKEEALSCFCVAYNITFYEHAFHISACSGNKPAAEYFFQKLTYEQRTNTLIDTVRQVVRKRHQSLSDRESLYFQTRNLSPIFHYILSVMSSEMQEQVFKRFPHEILTCFMDWPYEHSFEDVADRLWDASAS